MKNITVTLFAVLFFFTNSHGQAPVDGFFSGKGNTNITLGGGASLEKKFFAGKEKIGLRRDIYNANIYIGTGLTEGLDLYLSAPYIIIGDQQSMQDGSLFLKYRLFRKSLGNGLFDFAIAAGYSANLANYATEVANSIGQQAKVIQLRPIVHFKRNDGWFITGQVAYLHKYDPLPAAYAASLKLGKAVSAFYFDIWYDYQYSDGGRDYRGAPAPLTFRELGVGYHRLGGTIYKPLSPRFGFFAGTAYTLTGRNTGQGFGGNIGVVIRSNSGQSPKFAGCLLF